MATLTIRNLDENVKQELRKRAAERGVSMEQEARTIHADDVVEPARPLGSKTRRKPDGLDRSPQSRSMELSILISLSAARAVREPPTFDDRLMFVLDTNVISETFRKQSLRLGSRPWIDAHDPADSLGHCDQPAPNCCWACSSCRWSSERLLAEFIDAFFAAAIDESTVLSFGEHDGRDASRTIVAAEAQTWADRIRRVRRLPRAAIARRGFSRVTISIHTSTSSAALKLGLRAMAA